MTCFRNGLSVASGRVAAGFGVTLALSVVLAAPQASAVDNLVPGTSVQIIPLQDARFKSVAPTSFPVPTSGGADDPTIAGGSVRFFETSNPVGNQIVFPLAAADWQDIGHGFRYNGMGGPCSDVKVTESQLEIQCDGAMVTLTTPFSGEVGVTITVGTSPVRYCAVLGGSVIANSAAGVKRAHSPAPAVCEPVAAPFDQPLTGKVAVIHTGRRARFVSKDVAILPDAGGDAPTAVGATLRIFDTGVTGGDVTFSLPAAGWSARGGGYQYRGDGSLADPCRLVKISARVTKVVCTGDAITLTPPFAGDATFLLTSGGSTKHCVQFGGIDVKNETEFLRRKDAPAPGACP